MLAQNSYCVNYRHVFFLGILKWVIIFFCCHSEALAEESLYFGLGGSREILHFVQDDGSFLL